MHAESQDQSSNQIWNLYFSVKFKFDLNQELCIAAQGCFTDTSDQSWPCFFPLKIWGWSQWRTLHNMHDATIFKMALIKLHKSLKETINWAEKVPIYSHAKRLKTHITGFNLSYKLSLKLFHSVFSSSAILRLVEVFGTGRVKFFHRLHGQLEDLLVQTRKKCGSVQ